ncbi:GNAT family N-acetyltransferase [Microbacterium sp.]|uniref:GNAT family N-acetyltransferase n=1 Tax=Microbacterium sp. TaxID=51671 RepID=UPI0025FD1452|nr:GNAT family N-acetyltransferase [Microbacterium sp.]MBT9605455.1 GNAT family N-acetyltransferase [Microbacterium sp.]
MQSEPTIRAADPIDLAQLQHIERRSFPNLVSAGESALAYGDANILSKTNASDGTRLVTHLVATMDETVIGFAVARVFTLPGDGQLDPDRNVLLDRVAVLPDFRRGGVAAALVQQAVKQTSSIGSHLALAHVSEQAAPFYRAVGWNVGSHGHGLAWRPKTSFLHADLPDARLGFPLMAWRALRPADLSMTYSFPRRVGIPTLDAVHALKKMIDRGEVERQGLDDVALIALEMIENIGSPPARGSFGQRID